LHVPGQLETVASALRVTCDLVLTAFGADEGKTGKRVPVAGQVKPADLPEAFPIREPGVKPKSRKCRS